ncbi:MAG: hypothetical protein JF924_03985 [Candidatus Dormibacteraeota bacterium]|nr:hypothetical protein [Candidatus Dormibacteraeota bacterium]
MRRVVHFELSELEPERDSDGHGYVDFLASDLLSVGYAIWPAGGQDRQQPHEHAQAPRAADSVVLGAAGRL